MRPIGFLIPIAVSAIGCTGPGPQAPPTASSPTPAAAGTSASTVPEETLQPPTDEPVDQDCDALHVELPAVLDQPINPPTVAIDDPGHRILAPFYERLARLARGKADQHLRIAFYGDSNMTLDLISGAMRRTLQHQYGDGGHGYVAIGKPWAWYDHIDVEHGFVGEWATFSPSTVRVRDWEYGLGGIVSATREVGAWAHFSTAEASAPVGTKASRFGVFFDVQPRSGTFDIKVDGEKRTRVDTSRATGPTAYHVLQVEDAPHEFKVVNASRRLIRLYGVTLERDEPGIVLDCLGIGGISYFDLGRLDPEVNAAMLAHRPYDLVMFLIGANTWKAHENPASVAKLAALHRTHRKDQPILIMSPPDHTKSVADAVSDPQFVKIAAALHQAARDNQCAYWDLREAMGGDGSMARFFHANLAAKDLYHFTRKGGGVHGQPRRLRPPRRVRWLLAGASFSWLSAAVGALRRLLRVLECTVCLPGTKRTHLELAGRTCS